MALLGVKELRGDVRKIGNALSGTLRTATYAGAKIIKAAAIQGAPRKTGRGARFIAAARAKGTKTQGRSVVGFLRPGFTLMILSVGARRHTVTAKWITRERDPVTLAYTGALRLKKRRVLALKAGSFLGAIVFGSSIETSARRNPFMLTAEFTSREQVMNAMQAKFNEAIEKKEAAL